jgi:long-subunit acyl-CoA synthetase (AMP-forming)
MAEARTLVEKLREWAERTPGDAAVHRRGPAGWRAASWREYDEVVRRVGRALLALGHRPGDAVAILARNRPEWLYAQFGIMSAGGVPAPLYTTSTAEQTAFVVRHCRARLAFVENREQYEKLASQLAHLPSLERVILLDPVEGRDAAWTLLWEDFLALADKTPAAALEERLAAVDAGALAFLCYTSGTTGDPKGVMLSNRNLLHMARVGCERFSLAKERVLSYLPLCHVAEQFFTNHIQLWAGGEVFLCDDLQKMKDYLPEVRPTLFLGVPRVWEKFEAALRAGLAEGGGVKTRLARWALAKELACFKREVETERPVDLWGRRLARWLVISKIKRSLGLDRVKIACSGAAPIGVGTQEFFASLGLPVYEGYGMSETSALLTTNLPGRPRFGTVGRPFEGVELKLAEDGEILARGPNLCAGYLHDEAQTEELWAGGWLHTGDVGAFDGEGNLRITDRKKELLKTSGGKYVAPQAIEAKLKAVRGVGQAIAIGDGRKYVAALVTLDPENAPRLAAELGIEGARDLAALARDPRLRAHLERSVEAEVNATLARYETVKRFAVLGADFSVAGGELTPTMKLRRKAILAKYKAEVDALYADGAAVAAP